jgi:hypothetical protein
MFLDMFSSTKKNFKPNNNKNNKKTKKNKKQFESNLLHSGGGVFKIHPKIYTNIMYKKSGHTIPKLKCLQCNNGVFRRHNATHESKLRDLVMESDVFSKKYNIFVCYKCGFMMNFSGDISYNSVRQENIGKNNRNNSSRNNGK